MLNEGTSIQASICVSVRLLEGEHERPIQSFYGLQTLFCVTDVIFQSLPACQNMHHTCKNEGMKLRFFSRAVKWMVGKSIHLQSDVFCKEEKKGSGSVGGFSSVSSARGRDLFSDVLSAVLVKVNLSRVLLRNTSRSE